VRDEIEMQLAEFKTQPLPIQVTQTDRAEAESIRAIA